MAHPAVELVSPASAGFSDEEQLIGTDALLAKHTMMEESAIEIGLLNEEKETKIPDDLCFRDGKRSIDYVLAFETPASEDGLKEDDLEKQNEFAEKRKLFEANLVKAGLELEYEDEVSTKVGREMLRRCLQYTTNYELCVMLWCVY